MRRRSGPGTWCPIQPSDFITTSHWGLLRKSYEIPRPGRTERCGFCPRKRIVASLIRLLKGIPLAPAEYDWRYREQTVFWRLSSTWLTHLHLLPPVPIMYWLLFLIPLTLTNYSAISSRNQSVHFKNLCFAPNVLFNAFYQKNLWLVISSICENSSIQSLSNSTAQ